MPHMYLFFLTLADTLTCVNITILLKISIENVLSNKKKSTVLNDSIEEINQ